MRRALHGAARGARPRGGYRSAGTVEFVSTPTRRRLLLPRGQHAPPGRARRHRGGHGHRPRRVDGAAGRRRAAAARRALARTARCRAATRSRRASTPRIPRTRLPAGAGHCSSDVVFPAPPACASRPGSTRGTEVTPFYDPMLAKIIARGATRERGASTRLAAALDATRVAGIETNLAYLRAAIAHAGVRAGAVHTTVYPRRASPIRRPRSRWSSAGTQTTVQDCPGRLGYWDVGVPPSGPMDDLSFRLGQPARRQPRRRRRARVHAARARRCASPRRGRRAGAAPTCARDGRRRAGRRCWRAVAVAAGQRRCACGAVRGPGLRAYLAVAAASTCPPTSAAARRSRSAASAATAGARCAPATCCAGGAATDARRRRRGRALSARADPGDSSTRLGDRVIRARTARPTSSPAATSRTFFATDGGPLQLRPHRRAPHRPEAAWARRDGGEAGLHPSNIHDNAYAIGADRLHRRHADHPRPDGPSLGGFVCPASIVERRAVEDRASCGPATRVRFVPVARRRTRACSPRARRSRRRVARSAPAATATHGASTRERDPAPDASRRPAARA